MFSRLLQFIKKHRLSLAFLIATWAIFFGSVFLRGQVFYLDDLKIIYYPLEHEYAAAQSQWRLPQWSHLFGFGQPLMAWGQLGFFTPLHILLRLFQIHPLILLQVSIASYFLFGLFGMYVFLYKQKLIAAASVLGAILFVFSGFTIGHLNHVNFYTSTMWLPYLLLAAQAIIYKPSLKHAILLTLVATAITVSGQPQVILYTFIIASIISLAYLCAHYPVNSWIKSYKSLGKTVILTLLAAALTLALSAHSILPLYEFLPLTERSSPIPREQLLEFSYPPFHAITLILPYFFGDHSTYWGAKSFQELAAFTGIIPLMLAGISLISWKKYRHLRLAGLLLIMIAIVFALGRFSPIYSYLIENLYITTLNIPGRFVYFFNIGVLLLAAVGLHDLFTTRKSPLATTIAALAFPALLLAPFLVQIESLALTSHLYGFINSPDLDWLLILVGIIITIATTWVISRKIIYSWLITAATSLTLLTLSIPYNPSVPIADALSSSPFTTALRSYQDQTGVPARLYARENIQIGGHPGNIARQHTEPISTNFTVYQPLPTITSDECLIISMAADTSTNADISISLHQSPTSPALNTVKRTEADIYHQPTQLICFPELKNNSNAKYLKFSSTNTTTIKLQLQPSLENDPAQQILFVRVTDPTADQLGRSRKPHVLHYRTYNDTSYDLENFLLARHLNVIASSSSARWIGALSIRPYRSFIEKFFANDQDQPIDGDGLHALNRYRSLANMAGITHFASTIPQDQATNDPFLQQNYQIIAEHALESTLVRLYFNPEAYPKAYLVPQAKFMPAADEVRTALLDPVYDPRQLVYIDGPTPPSNLPNSSTPLSSDTRIISYTPTETSVEVVTNQEAILVMTDTSTPQWQTYLDGQPAPYYTANSFFKAAIVPPGNHTITFRYESPAIKTSNRLSQGAALTMLLLTGIHLMINRRHHDSVAA